MAAFKGLEFTMVANDFDADVFFMRFFDILLTYDELFCGGDGAHGKYWELPSSLKPKFRRALARSDGQQPPLVLQIDFPNADMPSYGWVKRCVVFHYTHTPTQTMSSTMHRHSCIVRTILKLFYGIARSK